MNPFLAVGAVAVGGALGSVMRYVVSNWFSHRFGAGFPWGTFTINVSGAFVIGVVLELATTRAGFNPYVRLFMATGILGGYTTFSTFAFETYLLGADGFPLQSLAYAGGSVIVGLASTLLGVVLVRFVASVA
jgi:CrcB protein